MYAMANLLTSKEKEWWDKEGGTFTWIIYTLDEMVRCDRSQNIRMNAASFGLAILEVTDETDIQGLDDSRNKSEVAKRLSSQMGASTDRIEQSVREKIQTWASPTSLLVSSLSSCLVVRACPLHGRARRMASSAPLFHPYVLRGRGRIFPAPARGNPAP